jgi:hypothetical protein
MRQNTHQSGFGLAGVAIVIVVLGLLGGAGWLVYRQGQANAPKTDMANTTPQAANGQQTPAPATATPPSAPTMTTYSKVPKGLQTAIVAQLSADAPECVKDGQPVNSEGAADDPRVDYDAAGYAGAGIGCGYGSWGIFAKVGANWKFLAKTQFAYKCSLLQQYHYPKQLLALNQPDPQCFDANDNEQPYNG